MAKGGSGVLRVDGKEVANKSIECWWPFVPLVIVRYWGYWNSGLAFKASFVAPGRTNFLSTNLN